ncbi:MAG TPA: hypothetical protein O0X23_01705 [Methanocorpusculum sp.]|nr:hypothetical protein [Methanocorpusculum sp.]
MTTIDVNGTDVTVKKSKTTITSLLPIWSETPKMDLFSSETDFETETQSSFWESGNMYNPDFNSIEFDGIKNEAEFNRFALSVKQWSERVNSRGIMAEPTHTKISPLNLPHGYPRSSTSTSSKNSRDSKDEEQKQLGWDIRRNLTKINYCIHTSASPNTSFLKNSPKVKPQ